jgi:YhcG PDDEXK nuclease domain
MLSLLHTMALMNIDAQLKGIDDAPSIGMILCKTKKKLMVEYTLQESRRPMELRPILQSL